jgi:hypothetical protein
MALPAPWLAFWEKLWTASPQLSSLLFAGALVAGIAAVAPFIWPFTRSAATAIHEGGHVLMALFWGRHVTGIKLHSDTSGVTISRGKPYGLGMILTTFSGYISPGLYGLLLAYIASLHLYTLGITVMLLTAALLFLMVRNLWGLLVVVPLGVVLYFLMQAAPELQGFVLLFAASFLLSAGLRSIIELQLHRMKGEAEDSDADQLQRLTLLIPGIVWVVLFFAIALACAAYSAVLLFT